LRIQYNGFSYQDGGFRKTKKKGGINKMGFIGKLIWTLVVVSMVVAMSQPAMGAEMTVHPFKVAVDSAEMAMSQPAMEAEIQMVHPFKVTVDSAEKYSMVHPLIVAEHPTDSSKIQRWLGTECFQGQAAR